MKKQSRAGLTFMELLIVITALTVLAVITFPKFRLMIMQSREGRTKNNLAKLRGTLSIYYSDNAGLYPSDLGTPETRLRTAFTPKYIDRIPYTELSHLYGKKKNTIQDRIDDQGDWVYSLIDGYIGVNSLKIDSKGREISKW